VFPLFVFPFCFDCEDAMTKPNLPPMIVSLANAAKELDLCSERIRQLIRDGLIDRGPRGKVSMISAYRGLVKFLRDDSRRTSKSASASRVQDARSREIELRTAEREGQLLIRL
jgi:hypothetical protein